MIENPYRAMRYFIDTEYDWNPKDGRIVPVSIALVCENGLEYYAVNSDFNPRKCSPFVKEHVLPKLPERNPGPYASPRLWEEANLWKPLAQIGPELRSFIGPHTPQFWGDYAAFDYVVLSMVMGEFDQWPSDWPMHINDFQQDAIPSLTSKEPHNALMDARAMREAWDHAFAVAV